MIVLDASALVELLFNTPKGQQVADRISNADVTLHAPHLIDVEVAQVVRRYVRSGVIDAERGATALTHLAQFELHRHAHDVLLPRIWALRENMSAYDAVYVALAEVLDAPLLTCDTKLVRVPGLAATVEAL